jgi:ankyrin repeat protein
MHAICGAHFSSASLLIEKGCELKLRDSCGDTLLHYLAERPNKKLIGDLMEAGLSLEEKNNEGNILTSSYEGSARSVILASPCSRAEFLSFLLRRGGDFESPY